MRDRKVCLAGICALILWGPRPVLATDFQAEYDRLDKKIKSEQNEPGYTIKDDVGPYVHWMEVKAKDRDQAQALAVEAGERNPYYRELFTELVGEAQISGNITVKAGIETLVQWDETRSDEYANICFRLERHGKALWEATIANKFDREIIRDRVRHMMRFSINNLEYNWLWCCEEGQSVAEREKRLIQGDFNMAYLPRSAFVKGSKTALDINPYVDEWLAEVEKCVRKPCEFFGLIGIYDTEATPMMEEYLEDTLCLKKELGHKHYLDLAKQYKLDKAREYIEGFYAKLKGTVWIEEEEGHRKPAKGAKVTVTDPKDNTTWTAVADAEGKYEIEKGLLHNHKGKDGENRCPEFEISAELGGDRADDTYEGPLREPDRNAEHKKDLVIKRDRWLVTVTYTEQWTVPALALSEEASAKGSRLFMQTLKAELNRTKKGEASSHGSRFYEATTANLDIDDKFQQVTRTNEGCTVVAGWHGEMHGAVGGTVRLELNDSRQLHLDSKLAENAPAWKTAFHWSGCPPWSDGACEKTDALSEGVVNLDSTLFTDSGPLVFGEGQDVIGGERRWSETGTEAPFDPEGTLYASANCSDEGVQHALTSLIYYGLATASLNEASKTIKWEIRRPGTSP